VVALKVTPQLRQSFQQSQNWNMETQGDDGGAKQAILCVTAFADLSYRHDTNARQTLILTSNGRN
jgi:hypothetical protein